MIGKCRFCGVIGEIFPINYRDSHIGVCKDCNDAITGNPLAHYRKVTPPKRDELKRESAIIPTKSLVVRLEREEQMKKRIEGIAKRKKIHYERNPPMTLNRPISRNTQQKEFDW